MNTLVGNVHPEFRAFWHPVAWSREVAGEPVATTLLGEPLVAVRRPTGEVAVFFDECPHRGAPLTLGRCEGDELVCASVVTGQPPWFEPSPMLNAQIFRPSPRL